MSNVRFEVIECGPAGLRSLGCPEAGRFLEDPCGESFDALYKVFAPRLLSFFRARHCDAGLAEDLTQDVMLQVFRKASQLRDRSLFTAWVFKIARHALYRHFSRDARWETVPLHGLDSVASAQPPDACCLLEFREWMSFLDSRERDVMTLRFVEDWEYHEIAAARAVPIGTVQWRVFNSKKKLASRLAPLRTALRAAA